MKKDRIIKRISRCICITLFVGFLSGCSGDGPFNYKLDDLEVRVTDKEITVENAASNELYYFVVERNTLARILWFPNSTEENRINPFKRMEFVITEIPGFHQEAKEVVFYYWRTHEPVWDDVEHMILPIKK
jgi:hypothetical protein